MDSNQLTLGSSVIVKEGIVDPDDGKTSIAGWCGRIKEIEDDLILIVWDSITIKNMSRQQINNYDDQGYEWSEMYLALEDVKACESRDLPEDVDEIINRINWGYSINYD